MPQYSFRVSQGRFSNAEIQSVFENGEAARHGALAMCSDLGRDIFAELSTGPEWQLDCANESGSVIFQIRLCIRVFEKDHLDQARSSLIVDHGADTGVLPTSVARLEPASGQI
jgi:hypothetical protein